MREIPGWVADLALVVAMVGLALVVERLTGGRLFTRDIVVWVGIGGFLLFRAGASLARAGRTLGCGFAFALTWVLPCLGLLYLMLSPNMQRVVRDSTPFFLLLGVLLLLIMIVTLERIRRADVTRRGSGVAH